MNFNFLGKPNHIKKKKYFCIGSICHKLLFTVCKITNNTK